MASGMTEQVRRRSFNEPSCSENRMPDSARSEKHVLKWMEKVEKYSGSC